MHELGSLDWETYSEAGYVWDPAKNKWRRLPGAREYGLSTVGTFAYAEHPSTDILKLGWRLPGESIKHEWEPGMPLPEPLFESLRRGGVFKAHNAMFELANWEHVAVRRYGFPSLLPYRYQLRCTSATARVNSYPGALGNLSEVLQLPTPKDPAGKKLLDELSVPRNPTKSDPRTRIPPARLRAPMSPTLSDKERTKLEARNADEDAKFAALGGYCLTDLDAEEGAAERMASMSDDELFFWWIDQEINLRGVAIDREGVRNCIAVLEGVFVKYGEEFRQLTGGLEATQLQAVRGWLAGQGVYMDNMDAEAIDAALERTNLPPAARRVLEIRQLTGSASVKKLYAMENTASSDNRIRNTIIHHGARTGRPTGDLVQPLNLPKAGPDLAWCVNTACARPFAQHHQMCPWCGTDATAAKRGKWSHRAVDAALEVIATRDVGMVEWFFGDALLTISGCVRGLFTAGPGHELIASDYSAIEAVVTAALAGEEWRLEAFRKGEDIYLRSCEKITGKTYEWYWDYYAANNETHHEDRQKIGKVNELANGFGGWIDSSRAFGSDEPDDVIRQRIKAWRAASPNIVELWGGQYREPPWIQGRQWAPFGFEGCAIQAIQYPGVAFVHAGIKFQMETTPAGTPALIVTLLSGRRLTYHQPSLHPSDRNADEWQIIYWTWNSNPKYGAMGWVPMKTYGGRLTENIVQATAHDILRNAIIRLRAAGYPCVIHIYDEVIVEVAIGYGTLEEVERIMSTMPWWAASWPILAKGGWRGFRFRKV